MARATVEFGNVYNFDYWKLPDSANTMVAGSQHSYINTNKSDVIEKIMSALKIHKFGLCWYFPSSSCHSDYL